MEENMAGGAIPAGGTPVGAGDAGDAGDGFDLTDAEVAEVLGAETEGKTPGPAGPPSFEKEGMEGSGGDAADGGAAEPKDADAKNGGPSGTPSPTEGETPPEDDGSLTVRVGDRPVTVARDDVPGLVRAGLEYQEARAALETERARLQSDPMRAQWEDMAKSFGISQEQLYDNIAMGQITQGLISQGVDEQVAQQRARLMLDQQKSEREKARGAAQQQAAEREAKAQRDRRAAEFNRFRTAYPEAVKDFKGTLDALTPYLDRGMQLMEAWQAKENAGLTAQVKELTAKLEAKESAAKAAKASTGSRTGAGGEVNKDPYAQWWDEA